jgi:SAM-dependent methyltransferase
MPIDAKIVAEIKREAAPLVEEARGKRVCIWGAGKLGIWLASQLGENAKGFIDSNPLKVGQSISGLPVLSLEETLQRDFDQILITVLSDAQAIKDELAARGLCSGSDFRIAFPGAKRRQILHELPTLLSMLDGLEAGGGRALEVGFGGQLYLALMLLPKGVGEIVLSDVSPQTTALEDRMEEWQWFLGVLREKGACAQSIRDEEIFARISIHPHGLEAEALPFPDRSFDIVANRGAMEHVADPQQVIREFARILRPGGAAVCLSIGIHDHRSNDPNSGFTPWSFLTYSDDDWSHFQKCAYMQNRWRGRDFREAFKAAGFSISKIDNIIDPRLGEDEIRRFDAKYRDHYTRDELAEIRLNLIATLSADRR